MFSPTSSVKMLQRSNRRYRNASSPFSYKTGLELISAVLMLTTSLGTRGMVFSAAPYAIRLFERHLGLQHLFEGLKGHKRVRVFGLHDPLEAMQQ